jgi:hypothetical protein
MADHETDYLIVGAGAVGLAFADTLLAETAGAHITIVDRHGVPGGHWNDAYSFVALHQPSAFYGVNSIPLGSGVKDSHGVNAGLFELASGAEVAGYFDVVMRRRLLASGRVRYLPMVDHLGQGRVRSLLTGQEFQIAVRRKIVDATWYGTSVPSTHTPRYRVEPGVRLVPPNALPHLARDPLGIPGHFVIVGAGKTAMDVGVWLLGAGVEPERIQWVMPRDSWLLNRRTTQPSLEFFDDVIGAQAAQMEACATAPDASALFDQLEQAGVMLRIYADVRPTMFHYATISTGEVAALQTIRNVIRLGHVQAITPGRLILADGERTTPDGALFIDCTATAVERKPNEPIFQDGKIVCQIVRAPQPAFSAALVAWVEAHGGDDDARNALCTPVPFPDREQDLPRTLLANFANEAAWGANKPLRQWIRASRLDGFGKIVAAVSPDDTGKLAVLKRIRAAAMPAFANLQRMI